MNDIATRETPAPVEITEDIQTGLNRLGRELETHAESGIRIGKELIHLKEITPHGKFGDLVEWAYGLKKPTRSKYMQVAEKFGEKLLKCNLSHTVLIELSKNSIPESARDQAAELDNLTVKQAKELAAAHRRIQELESPREANLDNLIPGLMKKYKGASLTIGMANRLSVLDHEQQKSYLELLESKQWAENKTQKLADEKLRALEDLAKATRERDEIKAQLEKVSESDTASVLIEKEQELKRIREDYQRKLFEQKREAEKTASEIHEQRFKDQIRAAEEAAEKARRERKEAVEGRGAANKEVEKLEREIEALKSQLEVDSPTNVDNARIRHIEDAGRGLLVSLNELRKDMDRIGGGMEGSISTAEEVIKKASLELAKLQGMQDSIITI